MNSPTSPTDFHLNAREGALAESIVYPGPRKINGDEVELCARLLEKCENTKLTDFMFEDDGRFYRGHKDALSIDNVWFRLRVLARAAPTLETLPSKLAPAIVATLLSEKVKRGGLIVILGLPGAGKTTTAAATLVSRLSEYGGTAYTLEDPPEIPLTGWHGERGICHQGQVKDSPDSWTEAFRGILRSQPAQSSPILLVGELREPSAVRAVIRAAQNGFVVITTAFGKDLTEGIKSLVNLAADGKEDAAGVWAANISNVLRIAVHQNLRAGIISASVLAFPPDSGATSTLRANQIDNLRGEERRISNLIFASAQKRFDLLEKEHH